MLMLALEFIHWWYGPGYRQFLTGIMARIHRLAIIFSVPLLIRTLGAPWRRVITYSRGSISDRARAALDNLISRAVGLVVRSLVILVALLAMAATAAGGAVLALFWPLAPVVGAGLVIWGLI